MEALKLIRDNAGAWNKKTVIFVHGIGDHPESFAEPLVEILRPRDPGLADHTRWYAVAYDFIHDAMAQKLELVNKQIPAKGAAGPNPSFAADMLLDLVNYLGANDLHNWINTAYKKVLVDTVTRALAENVIQADHEFYIVSHSLGTVVTYEVLHDIIDDAQTLGLAKNFRVKGLFTMGSPLAFIKKHENRIPSFANTQLRAAPIGRPQLQNAFKRRKETNVLAWYNFRHAWDPVASLVPLDNPPDNPALLTKDTFVFNNFHAGPNAHAFENYMTDYAPFVMDRLRD